MTVYFVQVVFWMIKKHMVYFLGALLLGVLVLPRSLAAAEPSVPVGLDCLTGFAIPEDDCALFIDLDAHLMTVYVNGAVYQTYPVSGGKDETPSPIGAWSIINISSWGEGFGGSWLGLNVPWGTYGIHGTRQPRLVGRYNVSHGCIRMRDADVAQVKKLVDYGTPVFIKHTSLPFREMENGMIGSDVEHAQLLLKKLGLYTGSVDGTFGSSTEWAVLDFQRANGLKVNGVISRETYDLLNQRAAQL
jgi:hypothetical protein